MRRDFKMSRFAATHPGDFLGNACAFLVATLTPKAPVEPCNCLVALRLGIFFVLYPAVISYLWFYYIPTRSIPK